MIIDTLSNSSLYVDLHPLFKKAFDFLTSNDLQNLALGKIELEGTDLIVNVVEVDGKSTEQAKMETHNNFIDIQIPLNKVEVMGWKPQSDLTEIIQPYSNEKDLTFYADSAFNMFYVHPLNFVVFFPEDGHQPGIAEGKLRKIIVKIKR